MLLVRESGFRIEEHSPCEQQGKWQENPTWVFRRNLSRNDRYLWNDDPG